MSWKNDPNLISITNQTNVSLVALGSDKSFRRNIISAPSSNLYWEATRNVEYISAEYCS